jgi:hypothetical protein
VIASAKSLAEAAASAGSGMGPESEGLLPVACNEIRFVGSRFGIRCTTKDSVRARSAAFGIQSIALTMEIVAYKQRTNDRSMSYRMKANKSCAKEEVRDD